MYKPYKIDSKFPYYGDPIPTKKDISPSTSADNWDPSFPDRSPWTPWFQEAVEDHIQKEKEKKLAKKIKELAEEEEAKKIAAEKAKKKKKRKPRKKKVAPIIHDDTLYEREV